MGFGSQNFLGYRWIGTLLSAVPDNLRRPLALRFLCLSPHYFYRTPANAGLNHVDFLEFEFRRNRSSREAVIQDLVLNYFRPGQTVLDYGCGPGFLARAAAPHVSKLYACDISAGALACARILNSVPNVEYIEVGRDGVIPLADNSIDVIYSFAVIMHVTENVFAAILRQWLRVLRPGGTVVCHFAIDQPGWRSETQWRSDRSVKGRMKWRFSLHGFTRSAQALQARLTSAGFDPPEMRRVADIGVRFEDDIASQHLWTFRKPSEISVIR
jgi:ubiquinone/menaquinone biosynthesis C-methylase UbiE